MGNENLDRSLHSAEYFGDTRDFWWHPDFLDLMARRWRLHEVDTMLDAGCGVGHWGRLLHPRLRGGARVVGVDAEPAWIEEATRRAPDPSFSYRQGRLEALPFADASFDMVTCQTVLIHVSDIARALSEMTRVLKPGGLLAVAEPNNLAHAVVRAGHEWNEPIEALLDRVRFQATCFKGKQELRKGHDACGDLLPAAFAEAGLVDITVYQSDMCDFYVPPHDGARQQAGIREALDFDGRDFYIWSEADTHAYFLAGGGDPDDFDRLWTLAMAASRATAAEMRSGRYSHPGGSIFYLIGGRKSG